MKTLRKISPISQRRGGTTLTEVLMALLCMGIGVVAVASLFPIALLRSVQATQLTSGTILRYNTETLIDIFDDYDATTPYVAANNRNLVFNPDFDPAGDSTQLSGHYETAYLVDPLGAMIIRTDEGRPIATTDQVGLMQRFDAMEIFGRPRTIPNAQSIVTLPDSWVTLSDEFPTANNDSSITLAESISQDVFDTFDGFDRDSDGLLEASEGAEGALRVVLFGQDGGVSEIRYIHQKTQLSGGTPTTTGGGDITWPTTGANAQAALPANNQYYPDLVSRVRIEYRELRYSWLITVRNTTFSGNANEPQANVDIVIFFRRSPSFAEETPFLLQDTGTGVTYDVNPLNQTDWNNSYPQPPNPAWPDTAYPEPFLKKGGFMLDTTTGKWHRISKVENTNRITLDQPTSGALDLHHAVFMRGVIDVYPLKPKPSP